MLQRMELLLKLTPAEDIQRHVLPMLYRGLDCESPQVHELCLGVLPTFAGLLDHANVKNSVLPRIKKLCLSTSTLSVRVNCLLCVGKLLEHLDKWLVLDEILPFLPQIPSREPAVLMGILGIYKIAMTHKKLGITKEIIASRVLPFLIPLCIENGLTIPQFNALTTLVKDMFQLVETEHRTKLEQLNSVKNEQKVLASSVPVITPSSKPMELDSAFSGLGLDNFVPGGGISLQQKQNMVKQQEAIDIFSNQQSITPIKTETSSARVTTVSLMDDWVSSSSVQTPNSNLWASKSLDLISQNTTVVTNPTVPNMSNAVTNATVPNMLNQNSSMNNNLFQPQTQNVNIFASNMTYNTAFSSPNPWSSSQSLSSPNRNNENTQNWSALDNLLPVNSASSSRTPMNMMGMQKSLLMPNNNSAQNANNANKYGLSNKDIADLLG